MPSLQGNNLPRIKQHNLESVKSLLYRSGPLSRTAIAEALDLTPATITNIVGGLIADGVVQELSSREMTHGVGRKPVLVDFCAGARLALGISLGRERTRCCLTDLRGKPLLQREEAPMPDDYDAMRARLLAMLPGLLADCAALGGQLVGIGLSTPGIVDAATGVMRDGMAPRASWYGRPLAQAAADATGLVVCAENDVRARAAATALFHPDVVRGCSIFAFCHVSWGIACPVILRSQLYSGETSAAGEIGHMRMERSGPALAGCGRPGSLESYASVTAILEFCRRAMQTGRAPVLRALCAAPAAPTIEEVLRAQAAGDPDVCAILGTALEYLGIALGNIVDFINPRLLIVSGPLFNYAPNLDALRRAVHENAFGANNENVSIVHVDLGDYGSAAGAAAVCLEKYFVRIPE